MTLTTSRPAEGLLANLVLASVTTTPGDANHDGNVDFNDLVSLAQNYNTVGGRTFEQGDFTGDGTVDFNDLVQLAQNYNTPLSGAHIAAAGSGFDQDLATAFASVPEPSLLGAMGVSLLMRRQRRRR
jgi:hypothetical protein